MSRQSKRPSLVTGNLPALERLIAELRRPMYAHAMARGFTRRPDSLPERQFRGGITRAEQALAQIDRAIREYAADNAPLGEADPEYPEHAKLHRVRHRSQVIGAFIDRSPYVLCLVDPTDGTYYAAPGTIEQKLAKYYGIDLARLDDEKREMLRRIREGEPQ